MTKKVPSFLKEKTGDTVLALVTPLVLCVKAKNQPLYIQIRVRTSTALSCNNYMYMHHIFHHLQITQQFRRTPVSLV